MSILKQLTDLGQSIWYDNIRRGLLESGEMRAMVEVGVRGVTSNPSIFEKAIAGSDDYDEAIERLVTEGKSVDKIYESLALADIQRTADLLLPVYQESDRLDGYVSLEVDPMLAQDTQSTMTAARRLFSTLGRPNVMIKVPATRQGIPAIGALIGEGININVTLIFSLANYEAVVEAYLRGLESRLAKDQDLSPIASVASFFVSRVDSMVDPLLARVGNTELQGRIAIANAKVAYERFKELFSGERWEKLASEGAQVQRPLWASTSTKNPDYPDTLYVDALIGPQTVNTVPPATLTALMDHAVVSNQLESAVQREHEALAALQTLGIDYGQVTDRLQEEGVAAFAASFQALMTSIREKREQLVARQGS